MRQTTFNNLVWGIFGISVLLPLISWGSGLEWALGELSIYQWFPLFGMVAWMIMWTHFFTYALRTKLGDLKTPKHYSQITGYVVLSAILLHPGLLAYAQWRNGEGLPTGSYYAYAGESLKLAIAMGMTGLLIFLSFEFFNRMRKNLTVKKYWTLVSLSQSLAMTLIFFHALRLGVNLGSGWFKGVWIIYGIALIPCFYIIHKRDFSKKTD